MRWIVLTVIAGDLLLLSLGYRAARKKHPDPVPMYWAATGDTTKADTTRGKP
jgi:hypothetical protein